MIFVNGALEEFIQEQFINGDKDIKLKKNTNLIKKGIIDSLGIMKLLVFIEETYDVHISDAEVLPEDFQSLKSICMMIESKVKAA